MTRTLSITASIVFAALLYVQFARVVLQPAAVVSPSIATTVPAVAPAVDASSQAMQDLAAWPMAAGR